MNLGRLGTAATAATATTVLLSSMGSAGAMEVGGKAHKILNNDHQAELTGTPRQTPFWDRYTGSSDEADNYPDKTMAPDDGEDKNQPTTTKEDWEGVELEPNQISHNSSAASKTAQELRNKMQECLGNGYTAKLCANQLGFERKTGEHGIEYEAEAAGYGISCSPRTTKCVIKKLQ